MVIAGYIFMQNNNQQTPAENQEIMQQETTELQATTTMMKENEMTVMLEADKSNNSTQSGTATLTEENGKVKVMIDVSAMGTAQPAHIHAGTCPDVGAVVYPLTSVTDGKSETMIDTTLADLKTKGDLAINIHKSAQESKIYTSCGNLPK
jgi:hypothetical protein